MIAQFKVKKAKSKQEILEENKKWGTLNHDINIKQVSYEETFDKETKARIITPKVKTINLTRQINATAKLLKNDSAVQKLNQIKEIFSKEN